jgi:hypothetical protein
MKNLVKLDNYFAPEELENALEILLTDAIPSSSL